MFETTNQYTFKDQHPSTSHSNPPSWNFQQTPEVAWHGNCCLPSKGWNNGFTLADDVCLHSVSWNLIPTNGSFKLKKCSNTQSTESQTPKPLFSKTWYIYICHMSWDFRSFSWKISTQKPSACCETNPTSMACSSTSGFQAHGSHGSTPTHGEAEAEAAGLGTLVMKVVFVAGWMPNLLGE